MTNNSESTYIVNNLIRYPYIIILVTAIGAAIALIFASENTTIKILGAIGVVLFLIILVDTAVKRKIRITDNFLFFRQSFLWKKWSWGEVDKVKTTTSSWFGQEVDMIEVVLRNGSSVILEETKSLLRFSQITDIVESIEEVRKNSAKGGVNDDGESGTSRS